MHSIKHMYGINTKLDGINHMYGINTKQIFSLFIHLYKVRFHKFKIGWY